MHAKRDEQEGRYGQHEALQEVALQDADGDGKLERDDQPREVLRCAIAPSEQIEQLLFERSDGEKLRQTRHHEHPCNGDANRPRPKRTLAQHFHAPNLPPPLPSHPTPPSQQTQMPSNHHNSAHYSTSQVTNAAELTVRSSARWTELPDLKAS